jgi:formate hydrogenlyase transcriptional activator
MFVQPRSRSTTPHRDPLLAWPPSASSDAPRNDVSRMARLSLDQFPHGLLVLDEEATILGANRQAESIFAYSAAELIGLPVKHLLPEQSHLAHAELRTEFWSARESRTLGPDRTIGGVRNDGVIVPLEIGFSVVVEDNSRYIVASIVDITERVNHEARVAAETDERVGFQRLVGDIAARFGSVELDELDHAIRESLRDIGVSLQLDLAILWRKNAAHGTVVPTHHWVRPPNAPPEPLPIGSIPFVISRLLAREPYWFSRTEDVPDLIDRETFQRLGVRSAALIPLASADEEDALVSLVVSSTTREQDWAPAIVERLHLVAGVIGQAFARCVSHMQLQKALDEIRQLRDRLAADNVELRREVRTVRTSQAIVSESAAIQRTLAQVEQVAPTPATVLLLGETGAGKDVIAQAIHDLSPRHQRQMVRVSCAAIPAALIESELFGRERGAYTGALSRQIGRFEAANQSTLFLDEIGELPAEVQVKLLRVLQERVIERLGSTQPVKVDVRIIAATNRNLDEAVRDKAFRQDLFYRLNVFPIVVPPLRERAEDIPGLVWSFIDEFSQSFGKNIESISAESMRDLQRYTWPGNVRELRNLIERAVIIATGRQLVVNAPHSPGLPVPQAAMTLSELEADHIRAVLDATSWRVRGAGGAAQRLGLKPTTLESRMARLGILRKKAS